MDSISIPLEHKTRYTQNLSLLEVLRFSVLKNSINSTDFRNSGTLNIQQKKYNKQLNIVFNTISNGSLYFDISIHNTIIYSFS